MFLEDTYLSSGPIIEKFLNKIIRDIKSLGFKPIVDIIYDAYYDDKYVIILNNLYFLSFRLGEPFESTKQLEFIIHKLTNSDLFNIIFCKSGYNAMLLDLLDLPSEKNYNCEKITKKDILAYLQRDDRFFDVAFKTTFVNEINREKISFIMDKIKEFVIEN